MEIPFRLNRNFTIFDYTLVPINHGHILKIYQVSQRLKSDRRLNINNIL